MADENEVAIGIERLNLKTGCRSDRRRQPKQYARVIIPN
jgi:hypothetical protein